MINNNKTISSVSSSNVPPKKIDPELLTAGIAVTSIAWVAVAAKRLAEQKK